MPFVPFRFSVSRLESIFGVVNQPHQPEQQILEQEEPIPTINQNEDK